MYCGFRYSKKTKRCPHCGKKHSQPFYHKWWFWFIVLIIACSNFYPPNSEVNDADSESNSGNVKQITMTAEEYKASCNSVSYIEIARNPNNYIGQKAVFSGKVIQVQENGEIKGIKDYTAVLGNQIPIPHLEAEYINSRQHILTPLGEHFPSPSKNVLFLHRSTGGKSSGRLPYTELSRYAHLPKLRQRRPPGF